MSGFGGIQTGVNVQPGVGVAGDFADANPRFSVDAGPAGLVAGPLGCIVGLAAWLSYSQIDSDNAPIAANNFGTGPIAGIVGRAQQGLITQYLSDASMTIPAGFMVTVFSGGSFWVKNDGSTQCYPQQKMYANFSTGKLSFAATGSPTNATSTASSIAASTFSVTGSISGNILTVTAVGSGTVVNGATISGTNVASGTLIVSQLSGTAGGVGTYALNQGEQTAASTTISGTYGTLTIGGTLSGSFLPGQTLTGSSVVAGTFIGQQLTGTTGGAGTYAVSNNTVVSSTAITGATNVETKWVAMSGGAAGELVKVSTHVLG